MACANICPVDAIYIKTDEYGFEAIDIENEKCIKCGKCYQVCTAKSKVNRNTPLRCFAAQMNDRSALMNSASGGAFQSLALSVLQKGGVCYGCSSEMSDNGFEARHIRIDKVDDLDKILNSKYIPSFIQRSYNLALKDLKNGKTVLFSGTPCQIEGLNAFLGKDYDNLITSDIICHGVTSKKLFNDYLKAVEKRDNIIITDYLFRDKSISWGTNFCYSYKKANSEKVYTRHCPREESSYMAHYLRGNIFRENCYSCTLANTNRASDFTFGDYWEIEREHPEFVTSSSPRINLRCGVSCILANTEKAIGYLPLLEEKMLIKEVTLDSITPHNGNLNAPSPKGADRIAVLEECKTNGYSSIDKQYVKRIGASLKKYRIKNALKSHLPDRIRIFCYNTPALSKIVFK